MKLPEDIIEQIQLARKFKALQFRKEQLQSELVTVKGELEALDLSQREVTQLEELTQKLSDIGVI